MSAQSNPRTRFLRCIAPGVSLLAVAPSVVSAQEAELQEIIVTAQKREQALQNVSAAVTAVGAERLEQAQINNLEDLQQIVPTITFGNDFNMAKIFIRGIGANTSTIGSEPGVAVHVDGAVIARAEAQRTSLFDLERIEVLRGPQGTLYGRNAVGGSINLITAKPTPELDGYARLTVGNYDAVFMEAAVGGPITERIRGRIAGKSEERGGFGVNPVTGHDVDDLNRRMARGHLQFLFTDNVDLLLTGEWFKQDDASSAVKFRRESFPGDPERFATGIGGYASNPRDLASEFDPQLVTDTWAITTTLTWNINDALTFVNISNYRDFESYIVQDLDVSAVVNSLQTTGQATTVQRREAESRQYSTEFQLQYTDARFDGVLGVFYFKEDQTPTDTIGLTPDFGMASNVAVLQAAGMDLAEAWKMCDRPERIGSIDSPNPVPPKRVCVDTSLGTDAWAVFGQTNIHLGEFASSLEDFTLKLGARYSWEKRTSANPAYVIANNGRGPVIRYTYEGTYREREFSDFTPEAGLQWQASDDVMLYYTYSEGFKSGAGENAAGSTTIVDPEEVTHHELGFKSSWANGRLMLNAAAFKYDLKGLQINKTISGPPAGWITVFENAADTSGKGVELELAAMPTDRFRLSGSVAWLDSQFDDFETADPLNPINVPTPPGGSNPPPVTIETIQLAGNPTRNSPEWAANLHLEFDIPTPALQAGGQLTLSGDVNYRDDVYFTEFHRLLEGSEAYTMFDASLRYTSGDERFFAELWGKNLGDELVEASTFALATARTIGVTYLPPRTYGLTVGYNF